MTTIAQEAQAGFEQCVVFVEHVTGVGYGQPTAASYLSTYKAALHSTPKLGDIAIWAAGSGGASSAGHVAVVTGLSPSGQVSVTGTNWPEGSGARTSVIGTGGMGAPTAFLTPSDVNGSTPAAADVTGAAGSQTSGYTAANTGSGWSIPLFGQILSGQALRRIGFTLAGLAIIGVGLMFLLRKEAGEVVSDVTHAPEAALAA